MLDGLRQLGRFFLRCARYFGEFVLFATTAIRMLFDRPPFIRETIVQMYHIGVRSLPLVGLAGLSTGIVMGMQTIDILGKFGATQYVAVVVGLSMVEELGPVITALLVAGRAGSGISAELGSMLVTRQIDALKVLAINPLKFLATTRIVACILVLPLLTALADFLGILGGMFVGVTQGGIQYQAYIFKTLDFIRITDFIPGLIKAAVFGLIIGTVACHEGFKVQGGTEGVGRSTTSAVVLSSLMILVSDVYMTKILITIWPEIG
jgi:phospholipid/cholesterol/gamma-HCH transport system permease protein